MTNIVSAQDIPTASVVDLLATYAAFAADARRFRELGYDETAKQMAANAYLVAAEVERRATPIGEFHHGVEGCEVCPS